jgi:PE-PPE domain
MKRSVLTGGLAAFAIAMAPQAAADGEGLVMGGAGEPTPNMAEVGASGALMSDYGFSGTPQVLTTPESFFGPWTSGAGNDVAPLVNEVNTLESADPGQPIWAFGYSESADIVSGTEAADLKNDPNLHLFVVGDADNPDGGYLTDNSLLDALYNVVPATPANLDGIPTTDVCVGYDGWCDWPTYSGNAYATANADDAQGYYGHFLYYGLTPQELSSATTTTDGSVTYVDVPNQSLPYLDPFILSSSGTSDGKFGDEVYDLAYAYYKVLVDLGYGHLDTISNGQVVTPPGAEFNPGDPGTVSIDNSEEWPSNITQAQVNSLLSQAETLDCSNYAQMVNDTPAQLAAWDATGANPAFDAAEQLQSLVTAGVDSGLFTAAQGAADTAAMFAGF